MHVIRAVPVPSIRNGSIRPYIKVNLQAVLLPLLLLVFTTFTEFLVHDHRNRGITHNLYF